MPEFLIHLPDLAPIPLGRERPEYRIGRTPDQDIVIENSAISRHHARIFWTEAGVFLEDLGSRHGCHVNGGRIHSAVSIGLQDEVRLAHIPLRLEVCSEAPPVMEATVSLALPVESMGGWRGAVGILHEISMLLVKDLPAEALLHELLDRLFGHLGATRGAVLLKESGSGLRILGTRGENSNINISSKTIQAVLERREAQLLQDSTTGGGLTLTVMTVPLEYEGEVLGLVYFDAETGGKSFAEEDLRFVAALCNLATAKIVHQRVAEELQRRREQERELEVAEASAKAKSDFLARMSHEIRTPMNAILGFAQLAAQQELPAPGSEYVRKIESSGRLLMGLLNDVLDLSKLEADRLELEAIPMDLSGILGTIEDLFLAQAQAKGLALRLEKAPGLPNALLGDPLRLTQVLVNLIGNALKFTEEGAVCLKVGAQRLGDGRWKAFFSVSDTGIGMSESFTHQIFDPFVQAEAATTRRYGGTGLGLSICKRLVDLMGGSIQVESRPGVGTRFSFSLVLAEGAERIPVPVSSREECPSLEGLRILVVEDYPINQELLAAILSNMGAAVDIASSGQEALQMVLPQRYAAVLMDVEMPDMDGLEVTGRLRKDPALATLPIIAMTAHADLECRWRCLAAGMNEYLTKPVDAQHLHRTLTRWINLKASSSRPFLHPAIFDPLAPLMDAPAALDRLGGNAGLLLKMLRGFLGEIEGLEAIPGAMAAGNQAEAMRHAHNFKGGAMMLSLAEAAEAAHALESCLLSQECEGWEGLYRQLVEALHAFREVAAPLLWEPDR